MVLEEMAVLIPVVVAVEWVFPNTLAAQVVQE
jgi:hypothetical protein